MSAREIKKTQLSKSKSRVGCTISNRGLTLIELLVTMSIATIILVAVGDLGTMTLRTSMLAKAQLTTNDLKLIVGDVLGDQDHCKANLNPKEAGTPPKSVLTGSNKHLGVGYISELKRDVSASGAAVVKAGAVFKGDLDIIQMRLQGDATKNPKHLTQHVVRDFVVYYKMRGVGHLGAKGPDCKIVGSTDAKLESDCYSVKCSLEYRLNPQLSTSHAEYNKVEHCVKLDCEDLSFKKGGSVKNKKCADKGQYLDGFDSAGTEICEPSGGPKFNVFLGKEAGKATTGSTNTFIGHQAGYLNTTGGANVFIGNHAGFFYHGTKANQKGNIAGNYSVIIGNYAGRKNNASSNTFIGAAAGEENENGIQNTIIGAWAGQKLTASNNVFIGNGAGGKTNNGNENVIIGSYAGFENITGDNNVFIGRKAGNKSTSGNNTFVGFEAGRDATASDNTFVGRQAGLVTTGTKNTFIGSTAGLANTKGRFNVFVGFKAGLNTNPIDLTVFSTEARQNVFIGNQAGEDNTVGSSNTFLGKSAGSNNTRGDSNIMIGADVSTSGGVSATGDNQLNIGNLIFGKMPGASTKTFLGAGYLAGNAGAVINGNLYIEGGTFKVSCGTTCLTPVLVADNNAVAPKVLTASLNQLYFNHVSSRVFKRNIVPYNDYNKALQDILSTPLFNYQYKNNHPDKTRMGVIAEDLPEFFKLKPKGEAVMPDIPTITGSLLGGVKALYQQLQSLKKEVFKAIGKLRDTLKQALSTIERLKSNLAQTQARLSKLEAQVKSLKKDNKELKAQIKGGKL